MTYDNLLIESDNAIATVTINRPKALNALNQHTLVELEAAFGAFAENDAIQVIIITGSGEKAFVAGADIAEIGRELGVGAVLEGSVQRSGDTLRIIAQLIRVSDQSHLWSKTFDRPTGDIFAVQDEIANAVVAALKPDEEKQLGKG